MWGGASAPIMATLEQRVLQVLPQGIQVVISKTNAAWEAASSNANASLQRFEPLQIVCITAITVFFLLRFARFWHRTAKTWVDKGTVQMLYAFLLDLPGIRAAVAKQHEATIAKVRESLQKGHGAAPSDSMLTLSREGISAAQTKARLTRRLQNDIISIASPLGTSRVSGTVYMPGNAHQVLLNEVYKTFSLANPLHADVFPSVRRMEAEVVAMTAAMLGGGDAGDPRVCGAMTSGGSESILSAVLASRNYMMEHRGIEEPELVMAESAHAAFFKAAQYFKIRLIKLPVNAKSGWRLTAKQVARAIGRNTVLVVASSPGFPHGVMDDVEEIAKVCKKKSVPLHVDACLGGFFLPFAREAGHHVPPFDFSVQGVTSMSADVHKFGQAHKGTSVVLYRSPEIRKYQYTQVTDWSGGNYISPGFAGSRSGALIATAWASMVHLGRQGYVQATANMLELSKRFLEGLANIEPLKVVGKPVMSVIAFRSSKPNLVDIYRVNDLMTARGWHLNALQSPAALHMCFTAAHGPEVVDELLRDLKECVDGLLAHPEEGKGEGMAPLYGQAAAIPDRRVVGKFLTAYQDILLDPR